MPIYLIKIVLHAASSEQRDQVATAIREDPQTSVNIAWTKYSNLSKKHYGNRLKSFNLVMISRQSPEYKAWIKDKWKKRGAYPDDLDLPRTGDGG